MFRVYVYLGTHGYLCINIFVSDCMPADHDLSLHEWSLHVVCVFMLGDLHECAFFLPVLSCPFLSLLLAEHCDPSLCLLYLPSLSKQVSKH